MKKKIVLIVISVIIVYIISAFMFDFGLLYGKSQQMLIDSKNTPTVINYICNTTVKQL